MNKDKFDVIVIGSGAAGSSAAYELAAGGLKVLVLEKERLPRYKTCGGGVVLRSANLLPFKIEPVVLRKFNSADVYDRENRTKFCMIRNEPFIFMTMRSELDYFLIQKAAGKGAHISDDSEVKEIENYESEVEITTRGETFRAKYVIACDGATGISMTKFRLNGSLMRVPAVESEIFVDESTFKRLKDVIRFDFGFVPHGYGWVFPKKDHLSVGVAFMKKVNQSIQNWFAKYLIFLGIGPESILKNEKHGYIIPLINGKPKSSERRVLFAGDTLGFADPLTAEGISYAIETGQLAARAVINNFPDHLKAAKDYEKSINGVFCEIKSAGLLSKVVYGPPALRKFIFKHWGNRLSELLTDVITGEKKYSGLVTDPLNYIKLFRPEYWIKIRRGLSR